MNRTYIYSNKGTDSVFELPLGSSLDGLQGDVLSNSSELLDGDAAQSAAVVQ